MPSFQLRLTRDFTDGLILALSQLAGSIDCGHWFVFEHEQDEQVARTHQHVYFIDARLGEQTLRNSFAHLFPDVNSRDFIIKTTAGRGKGVITYEGAVRYACKEGKYLCKFARGYERDSVNDYVQRIKIEGVKKAIKVLPPSAPRQMTKWKQVEICNEEVKQYMNNTHGVFPPKAQLAQIVIKVLLEHKQVYSHFKVLEICQTIIALNGRDYELINWLENNMKT